MSETSGFFIEAAFILTALGFSLFFGIVFGSVATRYRTDARYFLKYASIAGAFTAAAMALFFLVDEAISLPGPGNLAAIGAMFFAGFAAAVMVLSAGRWMRR